ncbi:uncharacterized protein KY384_001522 [Bacidia gigantensis]|uniref:uncharacterized protein n=1 Tax=Bacidia gigantensis TaxID=2732470 RepID=UPI001D03F814|nr:uncharacterized protein KY384_001522 [Bacidia gigantensis]KAG8533781.1 hypothetical protein KY384_001522 [Bacidia gigantensis]
METQSRNSGHGPVGSPEDGRRQYSRDPDVARDLPDRVDAKQSKFVGTLAPSNIRSPHYPFRVLPPRRTSSVDLHALHIPGSYKSELNTGAPNTPRPDPRHLGSHPKEGMHGDDRAEYLHGIPVELVKSAAAAAAALEKHGKNEEVSGISEDSKVADATDPPGEGRKQLETESLFRSSSALPSRSSSLRAATSKEADDRQALVPAPLRSSTMESHSKDIVRTSPEGKAMSILSNISGRRHSVTSSSISMSTNPQRGSAVKPSEINYRGTSASSASVTHSENHENEQRSNWLHQLVGKSRAATNPTSNLTARPSQRRIAESDKLRSRTKAVVGSGKAHVRTESTDTASVLQHQQERSQAFDQVVLDLENLLKEALSIAGKVGSKGPSEDATTKVKETEFEPPVSVDPVTGSSSVSSASSVIEEDVATDMIPARERAPIGVSKGGKHENEDSRKEEDAISLPCPAGSTVATRNQSSLPVSRPNTPPARRKLDEKNPKPRHNMTEELPKLPTNSVPEEPAVRANDWAYKIKPSTKPPETPQTPFSVRLPTKEEHRLLARNEGLHGQQRPPLVQPRSASVQLLGRKPTVRDLNLPEHRSASDSDSDQATYVADFKDDGRQYHPVAREAMAGSDRHGAETGLNRPLRREDTIMSPEDKEILVDSMPKRGTSQTEANDISLKDRSHFSIREPRGFSLRRSHARRPIARDWSAGRKRFVATVTCITTTLLGLILGIYAGEVPALQYALADEHHYTILGNVVFFLGMALTTILAWPLPVIHGRKTYTMAALILLMPLQFPQALSVTGQRTPYVATYRVGVLVPRAISGLVMGFANVNFMTTLLDLFGASLQSRNPHQEALNENDVRRHGGGMGIWLGISTWCSTMSIGVGFLIGACIISGLNVSWGFWITIILTAAVLLLNVITPETRRSPYRRSMAEVRTGTEISRRVARGEIKMHLDLTGPRYWYEEPLAGYRLCLLMLKQPGFLILALYEGWIYGQIVLIISLLGALLSKYYRFHPQYVGLGVVSIPIGALLAVPFQKASLFSRSRQRKQRTDSMTFEKRVTWTSHLVRRSVFSILLPFAGLAYTLSSNGSVHYMAPIIFAGLIGFLSNLAIAECNGLIMETFDTSDLQPGMTGRPRRVLPEETRRKRTNFSSFPRVAAGFTIAQAFSFIIAAGGTGLGGAIERHLGAQQATGVVAGILLILTLLLFAVLWRSKTVQIIPSERFGTNILSGPEDEWKPIIIGNPSGTTRRMSILELGKMSRWTEIRRRNRLGSI